MNVTSEKVITIITLNDGRELHVIRSNWTDGLGVSYDVDDAKTGLRLTECSYDEAPTEVDIIDLLKELDLSNDLEFFADCPELLAEILTAALGPMWRCPQCGWSVRESNADMIADHVSYR